MRSLLIALLFLLNCSGAFSAVIFQDDFSGYADNAAWLSTSNWAKHQTMTSLQSSNCYTGKCVRLEYTDENYFYIYKGLGDSMPEGYLGFWAKLTNKQACWPKFIKFFGSGTAEAYSNWTGGKSGSYAVASTARIAHGGSAPKGDTVCIISWEYGTNNCTGDIPEITGAFNWPDSNWHHFVYYWKLNTNTGSTDNADGAFAVWIDGVEKLNVGGVINRDAANPRSFKGFELGSYTDAAILASVPTYYIWFDDIVMASTYSEANGVPPLGPVFTATYPLTELPAFTATTHLDGTTDVPATCKYSLIKDTEYPEMQYFTTGAGTTSHSAIINNLTPGQNVPYYIKCAKTLDGEQNTVDYQINIAVANSYRLDVTKSGTGAGTVNGPGITCGTDCTEIYAAGTSVPLTHTPGSNSVLGDVTGEDSTVGSNSTVVMNGSRAVNVEFIDTSPVACSLANYWACDQPSCGVLGLYYRNWACRTTPPPTDITGANLVNGTFTTWSGGLPVGWFSSVPAYVQNSYNGVCLLAGAQNMAQIYTALPAPGTYRYEVNVRSMTSGGELTQRTGSDEETNGVPVVHTTAGTKTGLVTVTEDALNLYFELGSGAARTAVLDDFTLHLYSGPESDTPKESLHGGLLTGGSLSQ